MLNKIIVVIVILCLMSCAPKTASPQDYVKWVEDDRHGLNVSKEFGDIFYQVLYKPADYIVAKEWVNGGLKKEEVQKRIQALGEMQYFTLRIKSLKSNELLSAGITSENEYYQRLEYFMSYVQNDLYLIEDQDTLPCALSHFERSYGLAPYNSIVVAFGKSKNKEADKVFVYDDQLLGTGKVMLKVEQNDIHKIPAVTWN